MKTIHQLFHEFNQLKKPSDRDYMKLGHDLAKSIVVEPKNQHDLLWKFVTEKFPKYKSELIIYGATFYSESDASTNIVSDDYEELQPIVKRVETVKDPLPIETTKLETKKEIPVEPKIKAKEQAPVQSVEKVDKIDEHKEKMAQKVNVIRESIAKIDNNITALKEIKDPGFSMKKAIDALEKFRDDMNNKYKPPKPK